MTGMPKIAMVLAAGLGTRMRPLTDVIPKPLIKVAGKPLIDYALDRLATDGVSTAVVNVHYLADQLEEHLAARKNPKVIISDERDLLMETGGGLKKARSHFSEAPLFCTNTDAILIDKSATSACAALAQSWDESAMDALLLLSPTGQASGYQGRGDFHRAADGRIAFRDAEAAPFVFTGLQIISPALIDEGPEGPFSTKQLWDKAGARGRLFGIVHSGRWLHVGDPQGLVSAEKILSASQS